MFARAPIGTLALRLRTAARALRGHSQVGAPRVPQHLHRCGEPFCNLCDSRWADEL